MGQPNDSPPGDTHANVVAANAATETVKQAGDQTPRKAADHKKSPAKSPNAAGVHKLQVSEGQQRLEGIVVGHQQKFGFIKTPGSETRHFFHVKNSDGRTAQGASVTFVLATDTTTGKIVAFDVQTVGLPDSTAGKAREEALPGTFTGTVMAPPRGPPSLRIDDGMISFLGEDGVERQALFGNWRLVGNEGSDSNTNNAKSGSSAIGGGAPPITVNAGDVVEFRLTRNTATKACKATDIRLAGRKDADGATSSNPAATVTGDATNIVITTDISSSSGQQSAPRQLGRITLLKKEFGFIRQVTRPGDVFFHFTQLEGVTSSGIKVGDDVEYTLRKDPTNGKLSAVAVSLAPPGAVVFEVVSDLVLHGVILERPMLSKQHLQTSGVIQYTFPDAPANAPKGKIPFLAADVAAGAQTAIRPGDNVMFKIATNLAAAKASSKATVPGASQLAGQRGVQVTLMRLSGVVKMVNRDRQFGFISYTLPNLDASEPDAGTSAVAAGGDNGDKRKETTIQESSAPLAGSTAETNEVEAISDTEKAALSTNADDSGTKVASEAEGVKGDTSPQDAEQTTSTSAAPAVTSGTNNAQDHHHHRHKVFFHFNEVLGGVALKPGDEVIFVLHTNLKNNENNAQRVKRTKEAPAVEKPPKDANQSGQRPLLKLDAPITPNPNKLKLTGNLASGEHKNVRMPKMPDGTKGFTGQQTTTRGEAALDGVDEEEAKALHALLTLAVHGPPSVSGMKRSGSFLSIDAKPFVPGT